MAKKTKRSETLSQFVGRTTKAVEEGRGVSSLVVGLARTERGKLTEKRPSLSEQDHDEVSPDDE